MRRASGDGLLPRPRWLRRRGKRNGKSAAASRLALDRYAASMCGRDEPDNTQAKAAAAAFAREPVIDPVERLKDSSPFTRCDSDAVVGYRKNHVAVLGPRVQDDVLALIRILVGILDQVD